jgi:hypothetical protein
VSPNVFVPIFTRSDAAFSVVAGYHRAQLAANLVDVRSVGLHDEERHVGLSKQRVAAGKLPRYLIVRDRAALAAAQQMSAASTRRFIQDVRAVSTIAHGSKLAIRNGAAAREYWGKDARRRRDSACPAWAIHELSEAMHQPC